MNEAEKRNKRAAGVITTAALASIFVYSFVVSLPAVLINEVVAAFSLDGAGEGLMGTLTSLGFGLSLFFTILFQGRAQKSTILMFAFAAQALMLFFSGFSPAFYLFCIGCLFVGFSGGFIDTSSNSVIVDVQKQESSKYLGYLHGLFGIGSLLSPVVVVWALRNISWRGVHYALAIASCLVILLIFLLTRGKNKKHKTPAVREHLFTKHDLLNYYKVKRNIVLSFAGFFGMFTIAATMLWIVRYITLTYNAPELGAVSITVYWICATVNRFIYSKIIKRAPMKFFAFGALISGTSILIGVFVGNPIVLCVMMGIFGLCSGHFIPVLVKECAVGYEGRTTFTTAMIMFVMCIARIVSPVMMAYAGTRISLTFGMMIPVATAIGATACALIASKKKGDINNKVI